MKRRETLHILFSSILIYFILSSCEYESDEYYYMAVEDEVGNPYIEAVDLDFTKDTLFLNYTEYFIFNFNVNKEILNVKFFLNGTEQYQSTNNSGSFKFKKGQLSKGQYRLTMEILVKSGTGSIADKVGAEGYILTKEWILKISGDYLSQVKNYVQDGYLVLDWPEYLSSDFVQYVVCKQTVGYPGYEEIKRLSISQFVDSTYVGEEGQYKIYVERENSSRLFWGEVILLKDLPKVKFIWTKNNDYLFCWSKPKYYSGIDSIKLKMNLSDYELNKTINFETDTVFALDSKNYSQSSFFTLSIVPKKGNINYVPILNSSFVAYSDWQYFGFSLVSKHTNIGYISQLNADEIVFLKNGDTLIKYSIPELQVIDQLNTRLNLGYNSLPIKVSQMRSKISSCQDNGEFMVIESDNFNNFSIHEYRGFTDHSNPISISDNEQLV